MKLWHCFTNMFEDAVVDSLIYIYMCVFVLLFFFVDSVCE